MLVHFENKYGGEESMENQLLLTGILNILLPAVFSPTSITYKSLWILMASCVNLTTDMCRTTHVGRWISNQSK